MAAEYKLGDVVVLFSSLSLYRASRFLPISYCSVILLGCRPSQLFLLLARYTTPLASELFSSTAPILPSSDLFTVFLDKEALCFHGLPD